VTFGERVSPLRWACLVAGFVGVLMVVRPTDELFHAAMLLPLLLVAGNTGYQLLTSALTRVDAPGTIHFYSGLAGWLLTTLALPWAWQSQPPAMWAAMAGMGVLGAAGHFLLILAYTRTPVTVLTPYLYLQIFFGALGGWLVFDHVPDGLALAGIAVIFAGGVLGTWATGREMLRGSHRDSAASSVAAMTGVDVR
jgi:drug/metabolite transporter (DMT)-like permease